MARITGSEPIFTVTDIVRAVRFYRDVLGFEREWLWGDPPTHAGVQWGRLQVMFSLDLTPPTGRREHWFNVDDVQGLYDRHRSAGAPIVSALENKPWGMREYTVRDPDGYHLRFAGPVEYQRPANATDQLPAHIRVTTEQPSLEAYGALISAVGWNKNEATLPAALAGSVFCVTAVDARDGRLVGMCRVCGDGRQYTIWDVMVLPDYQGQQIGRAIMETAIAELRRRGPAGAFVGLFTGKPAFYEQFGFGPAGGMSLSL